MIGFLEAIRCFAILSGFGVGAGEPAPKLRKRGDIMEIGTYWFCFQYGGFVILATALTNYLLKRESRILRDKKKKTKEKGE